MAEMYFCDNPVTKAMVKAAREGSVLDPQLGKNAGLRSLHNNYFTLPVLFVMISNHFPSTFGFRYPGWYWPSLHSERQASSIISTSRKGPVIRMGSARIRFIITRRGLY